MCSWRRDFFFPTAPQKFLAGTLDICTAEIQASFLILGGQSHSQVSQVTYLVGIVEGVPRQVTLMFLVGCVGGEKE